MCKNCAQQVKEMDVRDSDLPGLPYKVVHWNCIFPDCRGHAMVRDYGLGPLYYWPVKVYYNDEKQKWRGGWFDAGAHLYLCSRHWDPAVNGQIPFPEHNQEIRLSKISIPNKKQKRHEHFL